MVKTIMRRILFILCLLVLSSCGEEETQTPDDVPETPPQEEEIVETMRLVPESFESLKDWLEDDLSGVSIAFERSCRRIVKKPPERTFGPLEITGTYADWQPACKKFLALENKNTENVRSFIEENFSPYAVYNNEDNTGLFTGYYEASLKGSATKTEEYNIPLHKRPEDLIMVDLGRFREALRGQRIAGRVKGGNLVPYEPREDIVSGNWPHSSDENVLVWVNSAVDAFFVQIQGSGVVEFPDQTVMRVGYAGQNGHPYFAIGRELINRGALTKENVSMQTIRQWLEENPQEADEVMNTNKSYVFFHEIKGAGPLGAEGIALTPLRSLAVDRSLFPYGMPIWLQAEPPIEGYEPINRLMIAQDTGGAIRGFIRGDVFWGYGEDAEKFAGNMKSKGKYWLLLPKSIGLEETEITP